MKLLYRIATIVILGMTAVAAKGQERFIVRGNVSNGDSVSWAPLDSVHMSLTRGDTIPFSWKVVFGNDSLKTNNKDGEFRLMVDGPRGNYVLTLDRDGFEPLMKDFELRYRNQSVVWLGALKMKGERTKRLKEVEVVSTAVKMVMEGDTIVYNAAAFQVADGSMLDALIKQLPGAQIDSEGRITVNGRFINSLLLNGKDFFKGDPSVALENLPAYTVNKIKVYDKASDDDYLTKASQKLNRRESDENLVLDVLLKKEYSTSYMASVEGGYGTDNRWLGRGFGLGFTDKWRLSAFFNANNIRDNSSAGYNGDWKDNSGDRGEQTWESAGADYYYEEKKLKINGNVTYTHEKETLLTETAATRYYNTGDIYSREKSKQLTGRHAVKSNHEIQYQGTNCFTRLTPTFSWSRRRMDNWDLSATFNQQPPDERSRTEALDSIDQPRFKDIMLSMINRRGATELGSTVVHLDGSHSIKTPQMVGSLGIGYTFNYDHSWDDSRTISSQRPGGANPGSDLPGNYDRYETAAPTNLMGVLRVAYSHHWTKVTEKRTTNWDLSVVLGGETGQDKDDNLLYAKQLIESEADPLPSLTEPEGGLLSGDDSYRMKNFFAHGEASATVTFRSDVVSPKPDGWNLAWYVSAGLSDKVKYTELKYDFYSDWTERVCRTTNALNPNVMAFVTSGNDNRYTYLSLSYYQYTDEPALSYYLRRRPQINPLLVNLPADGSLKNSVYRSFTLNYSYYGRKRNNNGSAKVSYSMQDNNIGYARTYDPLTGVTTSTPRNIDGNWTLSTNADYNHSFGKRKQVQLGVSARYSLDHNVDFQSTVGEPARQLVCNHGAGGTLSLTYTFKQGTNLRLSGGPSWIYATSPNPDFHTVNAMTYNAQFSADVHLPWELRLRTSMNMKSRHGYEMEAINKTTWIWNASLSKSILKGRLTFKLAAYDLLNQTEHLSIYINAQGRTETWTNTLPRYAMLSVIYRFNPGNKKPKHLYQHF